MAHMEIESSPMTMTAICVKEIATGPFSQMKLFKLPPRTPTCGWKLVSTYDGDNDGDYDHQLGILGDYVWKDLYPDRELIPFSNTDMATQITIKEMRKHCNLRSWFEGDL